MLSLPFTLLFVAVVSQSQSSALIEEVRVGPDSAPEYQFTRIRQGVQDRAGNLYVLLPREREIRVFSSDGRFLRRLGRRGQGPGEMMSPVAMGWRGDTLWVRDVDLNRVNLISTDGTSLRTILDRMPAGQGRYVSGPAAALLSDGSLLGVGDAPSTVIASGQITSVPMVRFQEGSGDATRLRDLSLANLYGDQPPGPQQPGIHFQQRLSDNPLWSVAPDGSAIAVLDRPASRNVRDNHFTITIFNPSGAVRRERRIEYAPKRLTREVRDSVIKITLNLSGRPNIQIQSEVVFTPDFLPPVTELFLGTDGRVWLKREFTFAPLASWTILDSNLQTIRTVTMPNDFRILSALGDQVWGTRQDQDGMPYIVRYRLTAENR